MHLLSITPQDFITAIETMPVELYLTIMFDFTALMLLFAHIIHRMTKTVTP